MGYEKLFEPVNIGPVEINNRLALAPMNPCLEESGYIGDATLAYYAERARGGVGLIITGATLGGRLASKYRAHYANPVLYDSTHLRGHYELVGKTLNRIRKEIPDYPIGIRMSTQEHQPDGFSFEEAETLLKRFVEEGISFYDVSTASHENYVTMFPDRDGTMLKDAARMRKSLGIPVITPGIHKPENAVKAVEDGQTDMIGLARAALADPEWANKVRQDKVNQIRKCARDYLCLVNILMGLPVRCSVNPGMGRERWKPGVFGPGVPKGEKIVARILRKNRWDREND